LNRSRERVGLHEWHSVTLARTGRQGSLRVDDQSAVTGQSRGTFTQLTLALDLFVGGHRNFDEVAAMADVHESFRGCVQKVSPVCVCREQFTRARSNVIVYYTTCVLQTCRIIERYAHHCLRDHIIRSNLSRRPSDAVTWLLYQPVRIFHNLTNGIRLQACV